MKVLKSKENVNTIEVALSNILIDNADQQNQETLLSVMDVAEHWAIHPRQYLMALDIEKNGLNFPVIVKKQNDKLFFVASGCRIQYAVLNGYTHIDAIVLEDDGDILEEMQAQRVNDEQILSFIGTK